MFLYFDNIKVDLKENRILCCGMGIDKS